MVAPSLRFMILILDCIVVFIFVRPFVRLAQDCAVSFTPRQLQKGDGLRKNGRLRDLFRVAEGALSGQELNFARPIAQHGFNLIFRFEQVLQRSAIAYHHAIRGNPDDVAPS